MKRCSSCEQIKPKSLFYADKSKSDGVRSNCKSCHNSVVMKRNACSKVKKANSENRVKWELENKEFRKKYKADWFRKDLKNNPEKYKARYHHKYLANKAQVLVKTRKRQLGKIKRTPVWVDAIGKAEIDTVYAWCSALRNIGVNSEVDHIIPLQGTTVSGLHVPQNLQVIHADDNKRKGNFYAE